MQNYGAICVDSTGAVIERTTKVHTHSRPIQLLLVRLFDMFIKQRASRLSSLNMASIRRMTRQESYTSIRRWAACSLQSRMAYQSRDISIGRCSITSSGCRDMGRSSGWLRWIVRRSSGRRSRVRGIWGILRQRIRFRSSVLTLGLLGSLWIVGNADSSTALRFGRNDKQMWHLSPLKSIKSAIAFMNSLPLRFYTRRCSLLLSK